MTCFKYSHNEPNDTQILVNGKSIVCSFVTKDHDFPTEKLYFMGSVSELFRLSALYFDSDFDAVGFESLSLPAQDAIYNALQEMARLEVK